MNDEYMVAVVPFSCPCCQVQLVVDRLRMNRVGEKLILSEIQVIETGLAGPEDPVDAQVTSTINDLLELRRRASS